MIATVRRSIEEIKAEMQRKRILLFELAYHLNRHPSTVARWFSGQRAMPESEAEKLEALLDRWPERPE